MFNDNLIYNINCTTSNPVIYIELDQYNIDIQLYKELYKDVLFKSTRIYILLLSISFFVNTLLIAWRFCPPK